MLTRRNLLHPTDPQVQRLFIPSDEPLPDEGAYLSSHREAMALQMERDLIALVADLVEIVQGQQLRIEKLEAFRNGQLTTDNGQTK